MQVFHHIKELLSSHNIPFQHLEHEATPTSRDSARVRGDALSAGAKAILYKIEKDFYLFVFAADRKLKTRKIKDYFKAQGKKAKKSRFASGEELNELTGLVPGSVPPFGRPILDFNLFVDPSLLKNEKISFNAGSLTNSLTNSLTILLKDYMEVAGAEVFDFTEEVV